MKKTPTRIEQLIEKLMQERKKERKSFPAKGSKIYAIGKNSETLKLQDFFNLTGIIDDSSIVGSCWNGIPLVKSTNADKKMSIINCSTSIRPIDTYHYLEKSGFTSIINFFELSREMEDDYLPPDFVKEQQHEIAQYSDV